MGPAAFPKHSILGARKPEVVWTPRCKRSKRLLKLKRIRVDISLRDRDLFYYNITVWEQKSTNSFKIQYIPSGLQFKMRGVIHVGGFFPSPFRVHIQETSASHLSAQNVSNSYKNSKSSVTVLFLPSHPDHELIMSFSWPLKQVMCS